MKRIHLAALAAGLAAATSISLASADTTTTTTSTAPPPQPVAQPVMVTPAATPVATSSSTTTDLRDTDVRDERPKVKPGVGLNIIGVAGAREEAQLGFGGRLEFITPIGLTLGGSYTQHYSNETPSGDVERTKVRPLLGEVGVALPAARDIELRPIIGVGYAFVSGSSSGTGDPGDKNASASATVATSGFDVAPGAKLSYLNSGFEVFTLPKYHINKDLNFFALELGAGARF
jgi:hypothetical protein